MEAQRRPEHHVRRVGTRAVAAIAATVSLALLLAACAHGAAPLTAPVAAPGTTAPVPSVTPASTPPAGKVLIRIIPDRTTVKAGESIPATIQIDNATGHSVRFDDHVCDANVAPGVENDKIPMHTAWAAAACAPWGLPTTGAHYRAELPTVYSMCGTVDGHTTPAVPACGPTGPPPLPPGVYRTSALWSGIDADVAVIDPVTITLTR